ncbi:MAG: hypothetical protein N4A72_23080 [Bacteroidales bacterium]|nr:hypothetical protein [Bacteroidales bacterium]
MRNPLRTISLFVIMATLCSTAFSQKFTIKNYADKEISLKKQKRVVDTTILELTAEINRLSTELKSIYSEAEKKKTIYNKAKSDIDISLGLLTKEAEKLLMPRNFFKKEEYYKKQREVFEMMKQKLKDSLNVKYSFNKLQKDVTDINVVIEERNAVIYSKRHTLKLQNNKADSLLNLIDYYSPKHTSFFSDIEKTIDESDTLNYITLYAADKLLRLHTEHKDSVLNSLNQIKLYKNHDDYAAIHDDFQYPLEFLGSAIDPKHCETKYNKTYKSFYIEIKDKIFYTNNLKKEIAMDIDSRAIPLKIFPIDNSDILMYNNSLDTLKHLGDFYSKGDKISEYNSKKAIYDVQDEKYYYTVLVLAEHSARFKSNFSKTKIYKIGYDYFSYLDGYFYSMVKGIRIGNTIWMAENMVYSDYNQNVCYNGNDNDCERYGGLYIEQQAQKIAQQQKYSGWHLPSVDEWNALIKSMGGNKKAYNMLINGGNSGFNAKLGGEGYGSPLDPAYFKGANKTGKYWCVSFNTECIVFNADKKTVGVSKSYRESGHSVRLVRDL